MELFLNSDAVFRALERVKSRFEKFSGLTVKAGAALGGAGAATLAGFKPALDALGENAKVADLADLFNISGEKASKLFGIMKAGGSDLRDAQEGLATFNQRVNDAMSGSGEEAKKLFKELGVSAAEFEGLDVADRFYKLVAAVKASNSPLGKLGLLMKAVGEDTGKNLGGVLEMTAQQMRDLGEEMKAPAEDLKASRDATRAQALAAAALGRVWREVAAAVAPAVKEFAELVTRNARPVAEFVRDNRDLVVTAFKVGGALAAAGAALVAVGAAGGAAAAAFGGILSAGSLIAGAVVGGVKLLAAGVGALLSPLGLAAAAVAALGAGLGYLFVTQTETGAKFFDSLKGQFAALGGWAAGVFGGLKDTAVEAWGGIVAAVGKGDLRLAGEVALTGLELMWEKVALAMTRVWDDFAATASEAWHHVTDGMAEPLQMLWADLKGLGALAAAVFTEVWGLIKSGWASVREALAGVWESIKGIGGAAAAALGVALAPVLGLVEGARLVAETLQDAWDAATGNVTEDLVTLGGWAEKTYTKVATAVEVAFDRVVAAVAGGVADAARVLAKLDPLGGFGAAADLADAVRRRADLDADRVRMRGAREVAGVERELAATKALMRAERERLAEARADERDADARDADAKVKALEARLKELTDRAKAAGAGRGEKAGGILEGLAAERNALLSRPGTITGQAGTFSAAQAAQLGVTSLSQKQLKAAEDTAKNTEATVRALIQLATGLRLQ